MNSQIQNVLAQSSGHLLDTPDEAAVEKAVRSFLEKQPDWVENAIQHDAAVNTKPNREEAIAEVLRYQGLHALALHEEAHGLYLRAKTERDPAQRDALFLEARQISQGARRLTAGIEIHPGASIGNNVFIDHGASLVVGETAEIGNNVFIYHGVTLGALDGTHDNGGRRHPKIGNDVTINNGVQILGPATIGDGVQIGAGARIIGNVTIGKGARIAPGIEVRKDVAAGEVVVNMVPNLPGLIDHKDAYTPITVPRNTIHKPAWHALLFDGLKNLIGGQPALS